MIFNKIAALGTYLDGQGHKEEAHIVDHMLKSIAEEKPLLYRMLDVNNKDKPGYGRDNMPDLNDETARPPTQPVSPTSSVSTEPIGIMQILQAQKGGTDPKGLVHMIYLKCYPDKPDVAKTMSETKSLADAIKFGLGQKVIIDDRKKWFNPTTWGN